MPRTKQELKKFADELRTTRATKSELKLQKQLLEEGYKFKFQYIISPFICDFVFLKEKKIIELDSPRFHNKIKDQSRDIFLNNSGYSVYRIKSYRIFKDLPNVLDEIKRFLNNEEVVYERKSHKKK